jgi:nicotinamidase-related amidase
MPLRRCALLVIDMQNDFCRRGAPFEVKGSLSLVAPIARLLESWREAKAPVVFTRYIADESISALAEKLPWVRQLRPPISACVAGHLRLYEDTAKLVDCTQVIDELAPHAGEAVFDKVFYSAFHGTTLMEYLAKEGVDSLIVAGIVTEMCVAETARHAAHFGLRTAVVSDACRSRSDEAHRAALQDFASNYGWIIETSQAEQWLRHS